MKNTLTFDSVAEMLATLDVDKLKRETNRHTLAGRQNEELERHDWHGTALDKLSGENPYQTMLRLLTDGWQRGVDLMDKVRGVEAPRATNIKRRLVWSDQGDEVDMQRIYAGQLDTAWRRTKRQSVAGPSRVRIVVDSIASAYVEADTMRWRGVAAMKLADELTSAGYLVEVESAFKGDSGSTGTAIARTVVKPFNQPVNLSSLAATTAMPGFFRTLGHALQPVFADRIGRDCHSCSYTVCRLFEGDIADGSNEMVLIADQSISSIQTANQWLATSMQAIEKQTIGEAA